MKRLSCVIVTALAALPVCGAAAPAPAAAPAAAPARDPIVHTFSIVARDSVTGDLGVAVQSHYFAVGPIVPWAEPGVGAVATQSLVEVAYGPRGLSLMRAGRSAPDALAELVAQDSGRAGRQVAMIDARGRVAAYSGPRCIPDAGHETGEQFSVQANLMANPRVWPEMASAYRKSRGDLPERLLSALEAGQAAGGDIRGQQSAAILVVRGTASERLWADRYLDLRVEDHPRPIDELRRLVTLWRAYRWVDRGDSAITANDAKTAAYAYGEAGRLAPENMEIVFWQAVGLVGVGRDEEALPLFKKVFARERQWIDLVPRLTGKVGILPDDPKRIAKILEQAPAK
ncbi:MAG: DUF1028 domain-containing protein [Candidatus Eiseniibacteriota bacterium]